MVAMDGESVDRHELLARGLNYHGGRLAAQVSVEKNTPIIERALERRIVMFLSIISMLQEDVIKEVDCRDSISSSNIFFNRLRQIRVKLHLIDLSNFPCRIAAKT